MALQPRTTFHDTSLQRRSVIDVFNNMSPKVVPMLKRISGGTDEKPSLNSLSIPCKSKTLEWIEEEDPPFVSVLTGDLADTANLTDVHITADHIGYFIRGTIFKIGDEYMVVDATSTGADPIKAQRGFASTGHPAHASGAVVTIVSQTNLETEDMPASWTIERTVPFNYVQMFEDSIVVTEMAKAIDMYGSDKALDMETSLKMRRHLRLLNRSVYYGKRVLGTPTTYGMFGGINQYIPAANILDLAGGSLEVDNIEELTRHVYDQCGGDQVPDTIVCNSYVRTKISKVFANAGVVTYRDVKERRGGVMIDFIDTHFGSYDIMVDLDCPEDEMYLLRMDQIGIGPLVGMEWQREPAAKTGPVDKFMLYGAYTLQMKRSKNHAKIKGISTTL